MKIVVDTDADKSYIVGRNGLIKIDRIEVYSPDGTHVFIDGISAKKGIAVNGGLNISMAAMDALAVDWIIARKMENRRN